MSLFLCFGKYAPDALGKISPDRTRKAADIIGECGGTLVAAYATLGEHDVVLVVELPGIEAAVKTSISLTKALGIAFTTAPAVTVDTFDKLVG